MKALRRPQVTTRRPGARVRPTSNRLLSATSSRRRTFGNGSGAVRIAAGDCGPLAEWIVVSRTPGYVMSASRAAASGSLVSQHTAPARYGAATRPSIRGRRRPTPARR